MTVYSDNSIGLYSFPPSAGVSKALGSTNLNVLAAKAFADPDAGYPQGLRLNAALNDNESGRFSLVNGLVVAGTVTAVAASKIDDLKELLTSVKGRLAILSNDSYSDIEKDRQKLLLSFDIQDIAKKIGEAKIGDFNLLNADQSKGISLDIDSGALSNIPTTGHQNILGQDQHLKYDPNKITFETLDVNAAFSDFSNLELLLDPNTDLSRSSSDNAPLSTVTRFETVLDQAKSRLSDFQKKINQTANDYINIASGLESGDTMDATGARQIAARLAQQLSNQSFNITANPALKYFSLFS